MTVEGGDHAAVVPHSAVVGRSARVGRSATVAGPAAVTARAVADTAPTHAGEGTRPGSIPVVTAGLLTVVYALISLTRFARLDTPSWDNAIFEQAIRGYAHLGAPIVDIKAPGFNQLGDHFSPVLALLAPVYRVFPHAQTLLIAQAVLVGLSVIPIGRAAIRALGRGRGAAITIAYGLSFGVQGAIDVDFHEVAFAAPLLAAAGAAYLAGRWRVVALYTLPLLLVKEDLGATVAVIGLIAYLAGARRVGLLLAAVGAVGMALIVLVVIPAFNPADTFGYWSLVGGEGSASLWHNALAGWGSKVGTLAATFGVTAFVALRSPWVLAAVPTLAWRFVGGRSSFWGVEWQYSLVLMPIVFIAAIDVLVRIREQRGDSGAARRRHGSGPWRRRAATALSSAAPALPAVMLAGSLIACCWLPVRGLVDGSAYRPNPRAASAAAVMALMPPGSSVETNRGLITHLTSDYQVYWFDSVGEVTPDYILFDTRTGNAGDIIGYARSQHPTTQYRLIYDHDEYLLAERVPALSPAPPSAQS